MSHQKPHGRMTAPELMALYTDSERHPNALAYELTHCPAASLETLAYAEHFVRPVEGVAPELGELARNELRRRSQARASLFADLGIARP